MKGKKLGGRKKGTPNKKTRAQRESIEAIARHLVDDPVYQRRVRARMLAGTAGHLETLLWHYAYGRPVETVVGPGPGGAHLVYAWKS